MGFDRDIGVAFASAHFGPGTRRGWDMLSATGARGLRLLSESGAFASFLFTEAHPDAVDVLARNASAVPGAFVRAADARELPPESPFDYVDIDPYGSPIGFVPTAIRAVRDGGVLAVTATDLMVLAGVQPGACERLYGSHPVRGRLGPESGLRILIAYLARAAVEGGRTVRPLLAYVRGHHVRVYLELGGAGPQPAANPIALIETDTWTGPYLGERGPYGPMWLGRLFEPTLTTRFVTPATAARPRETGTFLALLREEAAVDLPFYYEANELAGALGLPYPPSRESLAGALRDQGYRFARTHMRPEGFRTDAPRAAVERTTASLGGGPGVPPPTRLSPRD